MGSPFGMTEHSFGVMEHSFWVTEHSFRVANILLGAMERSEIDCNGSCTCIWWCAKSHCLVYFIWLSCAVHGLYLNKVIKKQTNRSLGQRSCTSVPQKTEGQRAGSQERGGGQSTGPPSSAAGAHSSQSSSRWPTVRTGSLRPQLSCKTALEPRSPPCPQLAPPTLAECLLSALGAGDTGPTFEEPTAQPGTLRCHVLDVGDGQSNQAPRDCLHSRRWSGALGGGWGGGVPLGTRWVRDEGVQSLKPPYPPPQGADCEPPANKPGF